MAFLPTAFECMKSIWPFIEISDRPFLRNTVDMVHPIPGLKRDYFATEEDLQSVVVEFFTEQDAKWYSTGIHKLILRYNNCLDEQGDYVEK